MYEFLLFRLPILVTIIPDIYLRDLRGNFHNNQFSLLQETFNFVATKEISDNNSE